MGGADAVSSQIEKREKMSHRAMMRCSGSRTQEKENVKRRCEAMQTGRRAGCGGGGGGGQVSGRLIIVQNFGRSAHRVDGARELDRRRHDDEWAAKTRTAVKCDVAGVVCVGVSVSRLMQN
jgi:hypothetical protein